jgi:hypothetical protein
MRATLKREKAKNHRPWWTENSDPCGWMIDLITAFIVAFAASIASALLSRIWEYF